MYQRLVELGVEVMSQQLVVAFDGGKATLIHIWSGKETVLAFDGLALCTGRLSDCALYNELDADRAALADAGITQLHLIGDAHTPGIIAQATFSGHRLAREIDSPNPDEPLPFIRERRLVGATEDDYVLGALTLLR